MPGALSYLTVRPPEALSYGAPSVDFSPIGNLNKTAREGEQYARERQLQTMFQPGTPGAEALANNDYRGILRQLAQTGGAPVVSQFLPQMMGLEAGQQAFPSGGQGGPATGSPGPVPQAKQPGSIGTHPYGPEAASAGNKPAMSSTGMDNQGQSTVRSLLPGDQDVPQNVMDRIATVVGAKASGGVSAADQPLTPQQTARAEQIIRSRGAVGGAPQTQPTDITTPQAPIRTAQAGQPPQETGTLPGDTPQAYQQHLQNQQAYRNQAGRYSQAFPKVAEELSKKADDEGKLAQAMAERMAKSSQERYGVQIAGEKQKQEAKIKNSEVMTNAMRARSVQYNEDMKPAIDISRSILNTPGIYTGVGGDRALLVNQVRAVLGDPKAAQLAEMLRKITAASVLAQTNNQRFEMQEAGGTSARIFSQQVDQVMKASPSLETTLAGNRALVEIQDRNGKLADTVFRMALNYRKTHDGVLDTGWDDHLASYLEKNPMYNDKERAHPELIGAPTVPPGMQNNKGNFDIPKIKLWAREMGLKPGEALRGQDGKYYPVP